jgi:uncharacterized linocin/CFP29 family protein
MANEPQVQCDPQVPWTGEQWARVNQVIQEEASRARVAATFLPLYGPLSADTDFVRREVITYPAMPPALQPPLNQIFIDDRNIWQLATLQVRVRLRGAQMADPEMTSALTLFRRAANVLARLEDAAVFNGLIQPGGPGTPLVPTQGAPPQQIWEITGGAPWPGLHPATRQVNVGNPPPARGRRLVKAVSQAIGILEGSGHFGPFAAVLDQALFVLAQTPDPASMVLPQDRITPLLGGGSLLRSTTLPMGRGVLVALGGAPVELVIATDLCLQFLQLSPEPVFLFRVCEKMALRIKEPQAIITLRW